MSIGLKVPSQAHKEVGEQKKTWNNKKSIRMYRIMPEKYYLCRAERHARALRLLLSPTGNKTNSVYYLSMAFEKVYSEAV